MSFVFNMEILIENKDMLLAKNMPANIHANAISTCDFNVAVQKTCLDPEKSSFFQALDITTKISRCIKRILRDRQTGDKVNGSKAILLNIINIPLFSFGLIIQQVFDNGSIYSLKMDIMEEILHLHLLKGICNIANVCLQINYPTVKSVLYCITNGYK
ncbi:60S acidic ribosomal protein P0-like [Dromiciops gliroides]|uniref:60S acidic ribosomal protein P0-like n=1 Tax=Dromiciops gliroides TaxID=33562 RepID=UPI001CC5FB17|nr:60S acidic ribosomal protein P0-like [Dromiciops gliroides]